MELGATFQTEEGERKWLHGQDKREEKAPLRKSHPSRPWIKHRAGAQSALPATPGEPDRQWLCQGLRFFPRAGDPIKQENNRLPTCVSHGGRSRQIKRHWHASLALLVLPVGMGLTRLASRSPVGSTTTVSP